MAGGYIGWGIGGWRGAGCCGGWGGGVDDAVGGAEGPLHSTASCRLTVKITNWGVWLGVRPPGAEVEGQTQGLPSALVPEAGQVHLYQLGRGAAASTGRAAASASEETF